MDQSARWAWQTLGAVSARLFKPGDKLLLTGTNYGIYLHSNTAAVFSNETTF
jgi:hypothetical protein